jgi:hypothetical protein
MLRYLRSIAMAAVALVGAASVANAAVNVATLDLGDSFTQPLIANPTVDTALPPTGGLTLTLASAGDLVFTLRGLTANLASAALSAGANGNFSGVAISGLDVGTFTLSGLAAGTTV